MSSIIILFCLLNIAVSLKIFGSDSDEVDVLEGRNIQLKWTFSTSGSETFSLATIDVIQTGGKLVSVAHSSSEFNIITNADYSKRKWTASRSRSSKEIVLNVKDAKTEDDGSYYLKLIYSSSTQLRGIRLNVLVKPHYPAGSYTQNLDAVDEGSKVTLKCKPEGSPQPIKIVWEKNNVRYLETDTTKGSDLVFNNVSRSDIGKYVCKASNKAGSADEEPSVQLTVRYKPVNTKFNTTEALLIGKTVTLHCSADADPVARFSFTGAVAPVSNSETGKIKVKLEASIDGRIVSCTPFNRLGNGPTVDFVIDIKVPAKVTDLPDKLRAIEGRNVSITCKAKGKPAAKIIWLKDGTPRKYTPPHYITGRLADNTYQTVSTLILPFASRDDNGNYVCQAQNLPYGSHEKAVKLNLMYLPEVKNKNDFEQREVRAGDDVTLKCEAHGNPATTYHIWRWENGTVLQNRSKGDLQILNIEPHQGGRLSCAGGSYIGEGKKEYINLLVRVPPMIIVPPQPRVFLNESKRLLLFCNASGVPKPKIHWIKDGALLRYTGDYFSISYVDYTDKGLYTCTADNGIPPNVSASSEVIIYSRPVITTTSATDTLLGAESGEVVKLVCIADALPVSKFKWFSYPAMQELNESMTDIISIQSSSETSLTMEVRARFGAKYLCYAYNNRGNDTQIYEIRPKGPPEAPILEVVESNIKNFEDKLSVVSAFLRWTPGYNGGQAVWYKVYYGSRADQTVISDDIDDPCNCLTIEKSLEANTDYVFYVQARNKDGASNSSNHIKLRTEAFYGSASVERLHRGEIVKVSFVIYTRENLTKEVRYREKKDEISWETRATDPDVQQPLIIEDLDPEKHYLFQVLWTVERNSKKIIQITNGGEVAPWKSNVVGERTESTLSKEEIIAVIAGVGGFLLIVILVLFLCLIRRRQKPKRDETVVVMRRQTQNAEIVTRRSLIGSVEDDPFESAYYGNHEKKKKARDSYYLPDSEDMNTFTPDETGKNPAENSQAYQPYKFGQKSHDDERSSSDDDSYRYKKQKQQLSDEELSSEPGYAKVGQNGKISRDNIDTPRDAPRANPNDVYAKVNKGRNNNLPMSNGRGAPPPYRPRSTADAPLPPYPDGNLDLDDPAAVPFDDPLPPPMPVLQNSHSIPGIWNDRYSDDPRDSVDTTLERHKSPSHSSLGGSKPYINARGKLVRPGSRHSSSEHFSDSEQRTPEPEVPTRRSRNVNVDNDESNLVSYLV
ncbi:uncharacterized protein LOC114535610 isoform X3 [Dendronephthya gigantea]|uniref:uncharacterized protein LOC114535610 isoform X3 n=1 Tax=Dendronephthya gigantea TaxID=151771 RepID=UPI00106C1046|nr:uncharacterized protein LOC114535610 isoform X3 [Dendronephthya gigantea]